MNPAAKRDFIPIYSLHKNISMVHPAHDLNQLSQRDILKVVSPVFPTDIGYIIYLCLWIHRVVSKFLQGKHCRFLAGRRNIKFNFTFEQSYFATICVFLLYQKASSFHLYKCIVYIYLKCAALMFLYFKQGISFQPHPSVLHKCLCIPDRTARLHPYFRAVGQHV